jgi:uncharacterized protein with HEPN domain
MSRRATPLLIEDIWEAVEKIERYVSGLNHDAFVKDDKTVDSVVRNLEVIGEAANRVPENIRSQYPEITWRKIIGLRNRIVHDYFNIDVEIVWEIVQKDLPIFKAKLSSVRDNKIYSRVSLGASAEDVSSPSRLFVSTFREFSKRRNVEMSRRRFRTRPNPTTSLLHSHQQRRNARAVRRLDRRCVHCDLVPVSRFIPTEFFVGLEIYYCPALGLLKGEIDYTLDEHAVSSAPRNRHFTSTPGLLRGVARVIQKRMRESSLHDLRRGSDLFCRCA